MLQSVLLCWVFIALAVAQIPCRAGNPQLALPSCMEDGCFGTDECSGGRCPCPQNLKGWCEMSSGIQGRESWFSRWDTCVVGNCPDDGDITNLMLLFVAQCAGTINDPLTNDTVTGTLGDWLPKTTFRDSSLASTAILSASRSVATLNGVAPTAITGTSSPSGQTTTTSDGRTTVLDNAIATSSQVTSTASSAPAAQDDSGPALNVAAIIGSTVGGTVLLALIIGLVTFFLRRRKRKEPSRSVSPPSYEPTDSKGGYEKPELDGQALQYQYSEVGTGAPVGSPVMYAELDGDSPVSPVSELPDRS